MAGRFGNSVQASLLSDPRLPAATGSGPVDQARSTERALSFTCFGLHSWGDLETPGLRRSRNVCAASTSQVNAVTDCVTAENQSERVAYVTAKTTNTVPVSRLVTSAGLCSERNEGTNATVKINEPAEKMASCHCILKPSKLSCLEDVALTIVKVSYLQKQLGDHRPVVQQPQSL